MGGREGVCGRAHVGRWAGGRAGGQVYVCACAVVDSGVAGT